MNFDKILENLTQTGAQYGARIVGVLLALYVGLKVAGWAKSRLVRSLEAGHHPGHQVRPGRGRRQHPLPADGHPPGRAGDQGAVQVVRPSTRGFMGYKNLPRSGGCFIVQWRPTPCPPTQPQHQRELLFAPQTDRLCAPWGPAARPGGIDPEVSGETPAGGFRSCGRSWSPITDQVRTTSSRLPITTICRISKRTGCSGDSRRFFVPRPTTASRARWWTSTAKRFRRIQLEVGPHDPGQQRRSAPRPLPRRAIQGDEHGRGEHQSWRRGSMFGQTRSGGSWEYYWGGAAWRWLQR